MTNAARTRYGAVGVVVNNAGAPPLVDTRDAMTWEQWCRNLDVDVRGTFNVTQAAAGDLAAVDGATLVNVAAGAIAAATPTCKDARNRLL